MNQIIKYFGITTISLLIAFMFVYLLNIQNMQIDTQVNQIQQTCTSICAHDKGEFYKYKQGGTRINDVCYCKDVEGNIFTRVM